MIINVRKPIFCIINQKYPCFASYNICTCIFCIYLHLFTCCWDPMSIIYQNMQHIYFLVLVYWRLLHVLITRYPSLWTQDSLIFSSLFSIILFGQFSKIRSKILADGDHTFGLMDRLGWWSEERGYLWIYMLCSNIKKVWNMYIYFSPSEIDILKKCCIPFFAHFTHAVFELKRRGEFKWWKQ